MNELTAADLAKMIEALQADVKAMRQMIATSDKLAVSATRVAKMMSIKRDTVYELHRAGILDGFRVTPRGDLLFSVERVRELVRKWCDERQNA